MPSQRNYYEILGLPRTATTQQIKKRYRELARKYHPDVVKDKVLGQRMFVQIAEAYKTLVDPSKRASYDLSLPSETSVGGNFDSARAGRTSSGGSGSSGTHAPTVDTLLRDAQFSFVKRRFNEAANLCRQAIHIDRRNARAHAVLGDVYRAQRKVDQAISEYGFAIKYDPGDMDSKLKLDKLTRVERPIPFFRKKPERKQSPRPERPARPVREREFFPLADKQIAAVNAIGWPLVFGTLVIAGSYPGKPIAAFQHFFPLLDKWTWVMVIAIGLSSGLAGALMRVSGLLENPDEELIFDDSGIIPTGVPLLLFSVILFWGAAAFYLLVSAIQGSLSRSVLTVFAVVAAIVLFTGFLYPIGRDQVWLFGGNVAFVGALGGWYGASAARPLSD